jgi:hypothetical protein
MAKTLESPRGPRRARRSAAVWQAEVAGWRASGLTAAEYAKSRDVHEGTLMGWASRLAKGSWKPQPGAKKTPGSRFIPVRVSPPAEPREESSRRLAAEVILTSGRRVRLSGEFRLDQLGQLLDALEGPKTC